jgi:asparagine N-glycosylation enzyme membrane subunit Stt3
LRLTLRILFELIFGLFWLVAISAWWLLPVFVAAILALFFVDRVEYQHYGEKTPEHVAILLLALRFLCVELAILIAPSLTPMLYLLFPFREHRLL